MQLLDAKNCYLALKTHDARFDGRFFIAVTSTRIYCRPIKWGVTSQPGVDYRALSPRLWQEWPAHWLRWWPSAKEIFTPART